MLQQAFPPIAPHTWALFLVISSIAPVILRSPAREMGRHDVQRGVGRTIGLAPGGRLLLLDFRRFPPSVSQGPSGLPASMTPSTSNIETVDQEAKISPTHFGHDTLITTGGNQREYAG
ncbi:uncharacterized protein BKA78DRAFT_327386 [Phyllosticta capitalensis]|uniref:uncharacterized protein n=1 Tax=Phyllosticta capitalensis TaxID=121624 RepID=UPI00312EE7E1